jgi:Protein of unknown function (DUF2637)
MSDQATARTRPPADGLQALRLLALAAVAAGVGLLAAAAFVLSYTGIHAVALYAGVPPRLARIYPVIFDAMLIVACAAVLSLRGAGLLSRCYAWLSMLVLVVTAATADTLHAIGTRLPHKPTAAAVAIIPWALVLIGFGLLLCMLRQARLHRAAADEEEGLPEPSGQAEVAAGLDALFAPKQSGIPQAPGVPQAPEVPQEPAGAKQVSAEAEGTASAQEPPAAKQFPAEAAEAASAVAPVTAVTAEAEPAAEADATVDLAIDTEPGQDDPASDEGTTWTPRTLEQQPAGYNGGSPSAFSPAPTMPLIEAGTDEPEAMTRPEPRTGPAAQGGPEPEAESEPGAENEPGTEAENEPEAKNEPGPGTETSSEPSAETGAGAQAVAETGTEAENKPEAEAGPEAGADPAPVVAAASRLDRMQSSPVPPGA